MRVKCRRSIMKYSPGSNYQIPTMKKTVQLIGCVLALSSCSSAGQDFNPGELKAFKVSDAELKEYISPVQIDGKWGLVNATGEWIIPAEYDFQPEWVAHDMVILSKDNQEALYSFDHKPLIPFGNHDLTYVRGYTKDDCFFYIRPRGQEDIVYLNLQLDTVPKMHGFNLRNTLRYDYNNYHGRGPMDFEVVNLKGETQLSFKQEEMLCWLGRFSDGMAPFFVTKHANVQSSGDEPIYYGYVNEKGKLAIPIQFQLLDQDKAFTHKLESDNRIDFEDGKALVITREEKYFIDKKGKRIKTLPTEVRSVYPVLKDGSRMIDDKLMGSDLEVLFENGKDGWQYNLIDAGYQKFMDNGFCIQHNDETKEFRIVNHKMEVTFQHPFEDETYIYSLLKSNLDSLYWLQREYKDSLNGELTRYNQGVGVFQGDKRLLSLNGKFHSGWMRDPYIHNLSLGLKYRWDAGTGVMRFEVRDFNNELIHSCEKCNLKHLWSDEKESMGVLVKLEKSGTGSNGAGNEYNMMSFRHKDQLNLLDPVFYKNPGFTLQFDEKDVKAWYEKLK